MAAELAHDLASLTPAVGRVVAAAPAEATPAEEIVAALRGIPQLDGLSETEYYWLATHATERVGPDGALIFREDEPSQHMNIILRGGVMAHRRKHGPVTRFVGRTMPLTGKLPFSRMKAWGADGRSVGPVWVLDIHESLFDEMLKVIPSMAHRVVALLLDRVRDFTRMEEQSEKLLALGKLAANLSHELNNPASAAQRSASRIAAELTEGVEAKLRLGRAFASVEEMERYLDWARRVREELKSEAGFSPIPASPLEANDREQATVRWLETHGVDTPWSVGPVLAEMRVTTAMLDELAEKVSAKVLHAAVASFAGSLRVESMARTVVDSSERIFDLISAIQGYSFMDQAAVQEVDLAQSIENTLAMFRSRLGRVTVELDFEPELPRVSAYGGELNQV